MTSIPLDTVFARAVAREPDALAVVDDAVRMTYAEWDAEIDRLSAGLVALGVESGDAVAAVLSNRVETASLFWACQRIGAPFVPFNWRGSADDFAFVIENCEATAFFYEERSEASALVARRTTGFPAERSARVGGASGDGPAFADLGGRSGGIEPRAVDPASTCLMLYTSGTTGRPKGVPGRTTPSATPRSTASPISATVTARCSSA
ncbi:MAG: AMP-binding protein [Defluviicoccus sp.]|nr:AMP-binding protein [Defluviicoccus sp.]